MAEDMPSLRRTRSRCARLATVSLTLRSNRDPSGDPCAHTSAWASRILLLVQLFFSFVCRDEANRSRVAGVFLGEPGCLPFGPAFIVRSFLPYFQPTLGDSKNSKHAGNIRQLQVTWRHSPLLCFSFEGFLKLQFYTK